MAQYYTSAPGQQQMAVGQPQYGQVVVDLNPWSHLRQMHAAKIKERVKVLEAVLGWEVNNTYDIFDQNGGSRFVAQEQTPCCQRQCVPSTCSTFKADIGLVPLPGQNPPPFLSLHRDCSCVFFCLNRPKLSITDKTSGQQLGQVDNPFACCDAELQMKHTAESAPVMDIHSSCAQWGWWCALPCGSCKYVKFQILDSQSKEQIGSITREVPGCFKQCISDADNYDIEFGKIQDDKWKAMILGTALFIDVLYFNENGGGNGA